MSTVNNTTSPPLTFRRLHYLKRAPCPEMKGFHDCIPHTIVPHLAKVRERSRLLRLDAEVSFQGASSIWPSSGTLIALTFTFHHWHVFQHELHSLEFNPMLQKWNANVSCAIMSGKKSSTLTRYSDVIGNAGILSQHNPSQITNFMPKNANHHPVSLISVTFALLCHTSQK